MVIQTINKAQDQERNNKPWAVLSMVATIIPILLWLYCIVTSKGSFNESGTGVVWWLMVIYYWTLGIPLFIMSLVFGVKGLKTNSYKLATASILLKVATIVGIILFVVFSMISS